MNRAGGFITAGYGSPTKNKDFSYCLILWNTKVLSK